MLKLLITNLCIVLSVAQGCTQAASFKVVKTFHVASAGGWDYLAINDNWLYVSHGSQVNILDKQTGDSLGVILNTTGVHGIALLPNTHRGYTSNGRLNNVTVFNSSNGDVITQIATGQNPDAIIYDNFSKRIVTCNGTSNNLSVINPATNKVVATIAVGGKPETAVSNHLGKLFVNIEDRNEIVQVNMHTKKVEKHWSLGGAEGPTGLAYDKQTNRLFAGCEKQLIVLNATTGKIVAKLPIGDGCDGVAFDSRFKNIYTSNGSGTLTVIHEEDANTFTIIETVLTKPGARTIAIDEATHMLYLPTANFKPLAADAKEGDRPKMIPGTFQVLVIAKTE